MQDSILIIFVWFPVVRLYSKELANSPPQRGSNTSTGTVKRFSLFQYKLENTISFTLSVHLSPALEKSGREQITSATLKTAQMGTVS